MVVRSDSESGDSEAGDLVVDENDADSEAEVDDDDLPPNELAERIMFETFGPASGDPDELLTQRIELDQLSYLNELSVRSGAVGTDHVAHQSYLRFLSTVQGLRPPQSPALMSMAESALVVGGAAMTNLLYGQGRYGALPNTVQSQGEVAATHNFGWYSADHLTRNLPAIDVRSGPLVVDLLNFMNGVFVSRSASQSVTYTPVPGREICLVNSKFDGMLVVACMEFISSLDSVVGLASGPINIAEATRINNMSDEEKREYFGEHHLATEAIEWMLTSADSGTTSRIGVFMGDKSASKDNVIAMVDEVSAGLRVCRGCLIDAFEDDGTVSEAVAKCDSYCSDCVSGEEVCAVHQSSRSEWHWTKVVCSRCVEKKSVCQGLLSLCCACDCCGPQHGAQRVAAARKTAETFLISDIPHNLKSCFSQMFHYSLLHSRGRLSMRYVRARYNDADLIRRAFVRASMLTTGGVRRRNAMSLAPALELEPSQYSLMSDAERAQKRADIIVVLAPERSSFTRTNLPSAVSSPRGMAHHQESNRLLFYDDQKGGQLMMLQVGASPCDICCVLPKVGEGGCDVAFVGRTTHLLITFRNPAQILVVDLARVLHLNQSKKIEETLVAETDKAAAGTGKRAERKMKAVAISVTMDSARGDRNWGGMLREPAAVYSNEASGDVVITDMFDGSIVTLTPTSSACTDFVAHRLASVPEPRSVCVFDSEHVLVASVDCVLSVPLTYSAAPPERVLQSVGATFAGISSYKDEIVVVDQGNAESGGKLYRSFYKAGAFSALQHVGGTGLEADPAEGTALSVALSNPTSVCHLHNPDCVIAEPGNGQVVCLANAYPMLTEGIDLIGWLAESFGMSEADPDLSSAGALLDKVIAGLTKVEEASFAQYARRNCEGPGGSFSSIILACIPRTRNQLTAALQLLIDLEVPKSVIDACRAASATTLCVEHAFGDSRLAAHHQRMTARKFLELRAKMNNEDAKKNGGGVLFSSCLNKDNARKAHYQARKPGNTAGGSSAVIVFKRPKPKARILSEEERTARITVEQEMWRLCRDMGGVRQAPVTSRTMEMPGALPGLMYAPHMHPDRQARAGSSFGLIQQGGEAVSTDGVGASLGTEITMKQVVFQKGQHGIVAGGGGQGGNVSPWFMVFSEAVVRTITIFPGKKRRVGSRHQGMRRRSHSTSHNGKLPVRWFDEVEREVGEEKETETSRGETAVFGNHIFAIDGLRLSDTVEDSHVRITQVLMEPMERGDVPGGVTRFAISEEYLNNVQSTLDGMGEEESIRSSTDASVLETITSMYPDLAGKTYDSDSDVEGAAEDESARAAATAGQSAGLSRAGRKLAGVDFNLLAGNKNNNKKRPRK